MREFDAYTCQLSGVNLIEASAGSGKTYNIQILILRMILEEALPVEKILTVTFTDAATAELRERTRKIFREMLDCCEGVETTERTAKILIGLENLPTTSTFYSVMEPGENVASCAAKLLRRAIRDLDRAAIYTIHGFCRRMLDENAFESGMFYDIELRTDISNLRRQYLFDFCRNLLYLAEPEKLWLLNSLGLSPELLSKSLKEAFGAGAFSQIVWDDEAVNLDEEYTRIIELWSELRCYEHCADILPMAEYLTQSGKNNFEKLTELFLALESNNYFNFASSKHFFATCWIENAYVRVPGARDAVAAIIEQNTEFFSRLEEFAGRVSRYWTHILHAAFDYTRNKLDAAKMRDNFMTFDDILLELERRLHSPGGEILKKAVKEKFCYALIDEFQDTDEVQFRIFNTLFGGEGDPERGFFMIGDPKQSIYAFRGGDVFSYLAAREGVNPERRYNLPSNYRSSSSYIEKLNQFYSGMQNPFATAEIDFVPIIAPDSASALKLFQNGVEVKEPLNFCKAVNAAEDLAVWEIARLLNGSFEIAGADFRRPLRPSDIAVLTLNSATGEKVFTGLIQAGVPAVFSGQESVFASDEAKELTLLADSVAEPGDREMLLKVLASPLIAMNFIELEQLCRTGEIALWQQRWHGLLRVWENDSFLAMFRMLMEFEEFIQAMERSEKRERKLANLLHLAELLHSVAQDGRLSPPGLLRFLHRQLDEKTRENDDKYLPKLPSEQDAVTITTVYKSKGLEFPLVILPDMDKRSAGKNVFFHDENGVKTLDMTDGESGAERASLEALQELLRLFYVGVTRAIYGCTVIAKITGRNNAVGYIVNNCTTVNFVPVEADEPARVFLDRDTRKIVNLEFNGILAPGYLGTSFSSIASGSHVQKMDATRAADYDDADATTTIEVLPGDLPPIFQISSGVRTGLCWHRIFEILSFDSSCEVIMQTVEREINNYGLGGAEEGRSERIQAVTQMIYDTLSSELVAGEEKFSLRNIGVADRKTELEFSYMVKRDFSSGMLDGFSGGGSSQQGEDKFYPAGCMMNGAIDLLFRHREKFYLLDWKSNRIGNDFANFYSEGMEREIDRHHYRLQYYIYTVALFKYLRLRGLNTDEKFYRERFGGVFYFFLRGVSADAPGRGIYFTKPDYRSVIEIERILG